MIDTIIFDLDGTLTLVPSPWRHVHERLGLWDEVASGFLDQWLAGDISHTKSSAGAMLDCGRGWRLAQIEDVVGRN